MKVDHGNGHRKNRARRLSSVAACLAVVACTWVCCGPSSDARGAQAQNPSRGDGRDGLELEMGRRLVLKLAASSGAFIEDSRVADLRDLGGDSLVLTPLRCGRTRIGIGRDQATVWRTIDVVPDRVWKRSRAHADVQPTVAGPVALAVVPAAAIAPTSTTDLPHLGGIFAAGSGFVALVDGRPVSAGDHVGAQVVETIEATRVLLRNGTQTTVLHLDAH